MTGFAAEPVPDRGAASTDADGNTVRLVHYPPAVTPDRPSGLGQWDVYVNETLVFRINDTAMGQYQLDFNDMVAKLRANATDQRGRARRALESAARADSRADILARLGPNLRAQL